MFNHVNMTGKGLRAGVKLLELKETVTEQLTSFISLHLKRELVVSHLAIS